jgi:hypothetical protein
MMDVPSCPRLLLLVTGAAANIAPGVRSQADVAQNAIVLAQVLGIAQPKVTAPAAVEPVSADMPATVDAAMLCWMADRGQITGTLIDGPLAFDNAVSEQGAKTKKIASPRGRPGRRHCRARWRVAQRRVLGLRGRWLGLDAARSGRSRPFTAPRFAATLPDGR